LTVPSQPGTIGVMDQSETLILVKARKYALDGTGARVRKAANLSQYEVAKVIGRSNVCVHRWEKGEHQPHGEAALRWVALIDALSEQVGAP